LDEEAAAVLLSNRDANEENCGEMPELKRSDQEEIN
jgi:hypothetical protein